MDFSFTAEQRAIADMAQNLFTDGCSDGHLKDFDASGEAYMSELWQTCVDTGLMSLYLPESIGGSGLGMTELMLVLQAQGEALAPLPLWRHQLATAALAKFAETAAFPMESAIAGETLLTLSQHERHDARGIALRGEAHLDGWRLDGKVKALPMAAQSTLALVLVQLAEGPRLAVLDPQAQGIQRLEGIMTHGEPVADLVLENVILPASHLLPEAAIDWLETRSIAALAALQLGVSEAQLKRTVEYIAERRQFERTIGSFQAVQMSMADARIALEALRSTLWQLCYRLDAGLPAPAEARTVAYLACEAGHDIGHRAQHVHGGIGVDLTYPIYRYLYWSRALGLELGGASAALDDLGDWLAHHDTLGWKYDLDDYATL